MAKQVENRVVEMEFKNKDFEKAVAVTLDSIEKLNNKLDSLNNVSTKGFDEITKAANKVDFSKLVSGIETIEERFTTITGRIKTQLQDWVIDSIIKKPLQELEKVADTVFSTIVDKGKSRAQNLAQAKFQLEALGLTWEQIYEDMDYAVSGTAYGLDEAAMAASQFAAANVKLGDEMKAGLRGISGVAAMTGRSYMEIAQIFTTVAGKGKAMNGEISRIEEKGLGAKAAIADFINETGALGDGIRVTTNDIFELASKGQISFDIFSKAMDSAFGEHATAANNLFTGALANTKAALGRIGERFATPIYEDIRQVLVALIPVINDFKKSLDSVVSSVTKVTGGLRSLAVDVLKDIHASFDSENKSLLNWYNTNIDVQEKLLTFLDYVAEAINGIGAAISGGLGSAVGKTLLNMLFNVMGVLKSVKDGIIRVFGTPAIGDIVHVVNVIQSWTEKLKLSEKTLNDLSRIISGIAAAIDIVGKTAKAIWDVILAPLLSSISPVFRDVLDAGGDLADLLVAFDKDYHPFTRLYNDFNYFRQKMLPIKQTFDGIINSVKNFAVELTGIHDLDSFFEKMNELGDKLHIEDIFYGIAGAIIWAFDNLTMFLDTLTGNTEFNEYVKSLTEQNRVLTWVSDTFTKIKTTIHDIVHGNKTISQALGLDELKQKFEWLNPIIDTFKEHYKSIFEAYEGEEGSKELPFIRQFYESLKQSLLEMDFEELFGIIGAGFALYWTHQRAKFEMAIAKGVGVFAESIQKIANGLTNPLQKLSYETDADKILKLALALGILAGSVLLMGKMSGKELDQGLQALGAIAVVLGLMIVLIGLVFRRVTHITDTYRQMDKGVKTNTLSRGRFVNPITAIVERVGSSFKTGVKETYETMSTIAGVGHMLLMLGAAIGILVLSVISLTKIIKGNEKEFFVAAATVTALTLIFSLLFIAILSVAKTAMKFDEQGHLLNNGQFREVALMIISLGLALKLIVNAIALLSVVTAFTGSDALLDSVTAISFVLLELFGVMALLTVLLQNGNAIINKSDLFAAAGSMAIMAIALNLMIVPIAAIMILSHFCTGTELEDAVGTINLMLVEMFAIVAILGYLSANLVGMEGGMLAGAAAMLIIAIAITALLVPVAAITELARIDAESLEYAVSVIIILSFIISVIVGAFGVIGAATSGISAAAMIAGAAAILVIAFALQAMTVALAGIVALEHKIPGGIYNAFLDLAKGLAALCNLKVAGALTILTFGIAGLGVALVIAGLGVLEFGLGIKRAGQGVLYFASALAILQSIDFKEWQAKMVLAIKGFIEGFSQAVTEGKPQLINGFLALLGAVLAAITGSTGMISEAVLKLLVDVITVIDKNAKLLGFHLGHALHDIVVYALAGLVGSFYDFWSQLFGGDGGLTEAMEYMLFDDVDNMGSSLSGKVFGVFGGVGSASGEAFSDNFDTTLNAGVGDVVNSYGTHFSEDMTDYMSQVGVDVGDTTGESIVDSTVQQIQSTQSESQITGAVEQVTKNAVDSDILNQVNQQAGNKWASSIIQPTAEGINSTESVKLISDSVTNTTNQATKRMLPEIETTTAQIPQTVNTTMEKGLQIENGESKSFVNFGGMVKSGFVSGILIHNDGLRGIVNAVNLISTTVDKKMHDGTLKYGSPSKKFIQYGTWLIEGLAIGMKDTKDLDSSIDSISSYMISSFSGLGKSDITNGAMDELSSTIASISEAAMSSDLQPTITPVLDLSNVHQGFSSLNSLFSAQRSMQLASDASVLNDAGRSLTYEIQNNNRNGTNSSINSLGSKLDRLGDALLNTQVVLDSGELVGGIASPMDLSLGTRAIMAQRA